MDRQVRRQVGGPRRSTRPPTQRHLSQEETATAPVGPEEALVADARGNLTPSQWVDEKLVALLQAARVGAIPFGRLPLGLDNERWPRTDVPVPRVEKAVNVTIITLTGRAIAGRDDRITAQLEGRTEGLEAGHLLLDFTHVERITNEELGTLIRIHREVIAGGGRLTLFNLTALVYEVFTVTRLHTLLRVCRERPPVAEGVSGG